MSQHQTEDLNEEGPCKVTQTLDVVTRLSHVMKRGLLKQRIIAASWSIIVFMSIQFYLVTTMDMKSNLWLIAIMVLIYILWVSAAWRQIYKLDAEYAEKLSALK